MRETLLDKAFENLNVGEMILHGMKDDDIYLNYVGYHLQQAVELGIKFLLEYNGFEYKKTHDIDQLLRVCHEHDIDLGKNEYIEEHAEMFSVWEAKTRYILGYRLEMKKIQKAFPAVKSFLEFIKENALICSDNEDEYKEPLKV